ncbi:DUF3040 domain-containing protein [Corynebacterium caspium]|uniref:DUF3040 domain-containing protein n=1 Tax=Corynebacterium caspium TaxID=234828 RepID=UPI000381CEEA|nr:DUF3040 domain-containing protein [Corynebacterium caspium]WKD58986.1 hypothetical protein CCASP_02910 [Corynebacterium caspium DSM 44850]
MALSDQERQALREIEASLLADDPKFGQYVNVDSDDSTSAINFSLQGIALIAVGLVMMVGGVALSQNSLWFISLSVAGFLVMFGAGIWMLRGGDQAKAVKKNRKPKSPKPLKTPGRPSPGGMNEDFRRRFGN